MSRPQSIHTHMSGSRGPRVLEWASPKQEEAFNYGPLPLCVSGGFGSSKTWALCLKALWLSDQFPKNRGIIARKVWEELRHTTMSTFFKICDPASYDRTKGGRRSDSEKYLRLTNGSEILWMHMDDAETENVIRGIEINWFILDQAEEIPEEIFDLLMTRLGRWDETIVTPDVVAAEEHRTGEKWRWLAPAGHPIPPTYPMIACNPDTELHWIYRRFHPESQEWREKWDNLGYHMISMASYENKFLPRQNLELMMQKDETFRRRFIEGEWGIPEGQIHAVTKDNYITTDIEDDRGWYCDPEELMGYIHSSCTLHRTLDHGDSAPTCCLWWAVDGAGNIFCYREYYQPERLISYHRARITELSVNEKYRLNMADPSIFYKTQQKYGGRWSVRDEYSDSKNLPRETALHWQPADNNEMGTRNRISEYLRFDNQRTHPLSGEPGSPRLFFILRSQFFPQGCDHVIRELRAARRKKIGTDQGRPIFSDDREETISDHAYDALRYFLASRPPVARAEEQRYPAGSFRKIHERYQRFVSQGGFRILASRAKKEARLRFR